MKAKTLIPAAFLLLLVGIGLGRLVLPTKEKVVTTTSYVTLPQKVVKVEVPIPLLVETVTEIPIYFIDTLTLQVDTATIIAEFLKVKMYDQVLVDDSTGYIRLKQVVKENALFDQELLFTPHQKTVTITRTVYNEKLLSVWAMGGTDWKFQYPDISAGVLFKNNYLLGVGYNPSSHWSIKAGIIF